MKLESDPYEPRVAMRVKTRSSLRTTLRTLEKKNGYSRFHFRYTSEISSSTRVSPSRSRDIFEFGDVLFFSNLEVIASASRVLARVRCWAVDCVTLALLEFPLGFYHAILFNKCLFKTQLASSVWLCPGVPWPGSCVPASQLCSALCLPPCLAASHASRPLLHALNCLPCRQALLPLAR